jgi:hypothetical protein
MLLICATATVAFATAVDTVKEDFQVSSNSKFEEADANDENPLQMDQSGFTWGGYIAGLNGTKNANIKIASNERVRIGEATNVAGTYIYTIFDPNLADGNNGDVSDPNVLNVDLSLGSAQIVTEIRRSDEATGLLYLIRDKFGNWFKSSWGNSASGRGYLSIGTAGMFWIPLDAASMDNLNLLAGGDEMAVTEDFAGPIEDLSAATGGGIYIDSAPATPSRLIIERMRWRDGTVPLNDEPGVFAGYNWPSTEQGKPAVYPWAQPVSLSEAEVWDDIVINPLDIPVEWSVSATPNDPNVPGYAFDPNTGLDPNLAALVTISNTTILHPTVTLPNYAGKYTLMLTATDPYDANLIGFATVNLTLTSNLAPSVDINEPNQPIIVYIAEDDSVTFSDAYYLDADTEPNHLSPSYTWSVLSQPNGANATFDNASLLNATATFDLEGDYTLQLEASDGELSDTDTVTIKAFPKFLKELIITGPNDIEDTFVNAQSKDENKGTDSSLYLREGSSERLSYLKFDLSSMPGNIYSASLRLFATNGANDVNALDLFDVNAVAVTYGPSGEWGEMTLTYNNDDLVWGNTLDTHIKINDDDTRLFDVTGMVIEEDGKATIGLARFDVASNQKKLGSSENSADHKQPKLTIYYDPNQAYGPTPLENEINVSPDATLNWTKGAAAANVDVFFGTTSGALGAAVDTANTSDTFDPNGAGPMAEGTTYFWRIDGSDGSVGEEWSFTTQLNAAPDVNAGPDLTVYTAGSNTVAIDANVSDDYIPGGGSISYAWTQLSGPGTAYISNASIEDPTVGFDNTAIGTYELKLTASDGEKDANDTVQITVYQNPVTTLVIEGPNDINDTYVREGSNGDKNYGASNQMWARGDRFSFVKIDLTGVSGIVDAKIKLYEFAAPGAGLNVEAKAVTYGPLGEWLEGTLDGADVNEALGHDPNWLTHNNHTDFIVWGDVLDTQLVFDDSYSTFDITNLVKESDQKATIGFRAVAGQGNNQVKFNTTDKDDVDKWPVITIIYDPNVPTLLSPADEVNEVLVGASFTWAPGASSVSDTLYYGTDINNLTPVPGITDGNYTPAVELDELSIYHWRVVGSDGTHSETRSFETGSATFVTIQVTAIEDTHTQKNQDYGHNGDNKLQVMAQSHNRARNAFIKFDVGAIAGNVIDAYITVTVDSGPQTDLSAYQVKGQWHDDSLTWNLADANLAWSSILDTEVEANIFDGNAIYFDVVDADYQTADGNVSFGFQSVANGSGKGLSSIESGSPAKLTLTYNKNQPYGPTPANVATGVHPSTDLEWTRGRNAATDTVYLGTDPCIMAEVDTSNAAELYNPPSDLTLSETYHWRIVGSDGTIGPIWSFTVAAVHPDIPETLAPVNGAEGLAIPDDLNFEWTAGLNATSWDIYIGDDYNDVNDETATSQASVTSPFDADANGWAFTLEGTVYWKVVAQGPGGPWVSDINSFTLGNEDRIERFKGDLTSWAASEGATGMALDVNVVDNGTASMIIDYNDAATGNSAVTMTMLDNHRDWTAPTGRVALRIRVKGRTANDDDDISITITDGSANSGTVPITAQYGLDRQDWKGWFSLNVDLADPLLSSVILSDVEKITITIGDGSNDGEAGTLNIDSVGLHTSKCRAFEIGGIGAPGINCQGDIADLFVIARDWLSIEETVSATTASTTGLIALLDFEEPNGPNSYSSVTYDDGNSVVFDIENAADVNMAQTGYTGNSYHFKGSGRLSTAEPNFLALITDKVTVAMWVYGDPNELTLQPNLSFESKQLVRFRKSGNGNALRMFAPNGSGNITAGQGAFPTATYNSEDLADVMGSWHHVAMVLDIDADRVEAYLDGVLVAANTNYITGDLAGLNELELPYDFGGWIDEARVYNRALDQSEIIDLAGLPSVVQPINGAGDQYEDGAVNFLDLATIGSIWGEQLLWP